MKRGWRIAGGIAFGALFLVLFAAITRLLWNWLIPDLFGGPVINFWQAIGLLALSKILFWSGGRGCWHSPSHNTNHWKNRFYEKFSNMSPEERDALKQKLQEKWCGRGPMPPSNPDNSNV